MCQNAFVSWMKRKFRGWDYSSIPGHRNWEIEPAVCNGAGFFTVLWRAASGGALSPPHSHSHYARVYTEFPLKPWHSYFFIFWLQPTHTAYTSWIDGYCSTVHGLLDWFEVDWGFTKLSFIQIGLCVLCVFVRYSRVSLSSFPFLNILHCLPRAVVVPLAWEQALNLVRSTRPTARSRSTTPYLAPTTTTALRP